MPRMTVNIDGPILKDLRKLQKRERKSLGRLISELLARALSELRVGGGRKPAFHWITRTMRARVDLLDKEAVRSALDEQD